MKNTPALIYVLSDSSTLSHAYIIIGSVSYIEKKKAKKKKKKGKRNFFFLFTYDS